MQLAYRIAHPRYGTLKGTVVQDHTFRALSPHFYFEAIALHRTMFCLGNTFLYAKIRAIVHNSDITMQDYLAAGYFLTKPILRRDEHNPALLPEIMVSISGCLTGFIPTAYWNDYLNPEELALGLKQDHLPAIKQWTEAAFGSLVGFPDVFFTVEAARIFARHFLAHEPQMLLLGVGLHVSHARGLLHDEKMANHIGENGLYELLKRNQPLADGGIGLGYEPVAYEHGLMDSWLCSFLETEAHARFNSKPNNVGLFSTLAEADEIAGAINRGELEAEPMPYYPWLVMRYVLD